MYNFEQNKSTWSHIEYLSHNVKQKSSLTHGIANLWTKHHQSKKKMYQSSTRFTSIETKLPGRAPNSTQTYLL